MVEVGKGLRSTSKSILWQNCCSEGLMMDGWKRLIFGLVVCAAGVELLPTFRRHGSMLLFPNAMERVLLDCRDNAAVVTYSTTLNFTIRVRSLKI